MRVSAKADYAVRAMIVLASAPEGEPVKGDAIAQEQTIPLAFMENILSELRQAGLVHSRRGAEGGYWLAVDASKISIADIIRAVEGPLATVRGEDPDELRYRGDAEPLKRVWLALRTNVRSVLEGVSLAQVISGELPAVVGGSTSADPDPVA
jgi:Rrf2 family protein